MIVITGGSGFIGTHLSELLIEQGHAVRIIDIVPVPLGSKAEFVRATILDPGRLQKLFAGADAVVHLAALIDVQASIADPASDFQVNAVGTLNVLEAARRAGVPKVAFASSAAVYGNPEEMPVPESHATVPLSPYGASKLSAERLVVLYNRLYSMQNTALRLFNVFGRGQNPASPYSGVITKFANALAEGKQPLIYGDGKQTRDFVHVDDVANAFLLAIESQGNESPINIGSGVETSLLELLGKMCYFSDNKMNPKFMPEREGEIMRSVASISLAKKTLGYSPKIALGQGLKEIVSQG
jgi:UDP-glucose 4-epimerase